MGAIGLSTVLQSRRNALVRADWASFLPLCGENTAATIITAHYTISRGVTQSLPIRSPREKILHQWTQSNKLARPKLQFPIFFLFSLRHQK